MAKGKKTGGRTKGTPNKITSEIRERFALLVKNNIGKLQNDINSLDPKCRIKYTLELAKFVVPTLKATDLIIDGDKKEPYDYSMMSTEDLKTIISIHKKYVK